LSTETRTLALGLDGYVVQKRMIGLPLQHYESHDFSTYCQHPYVSLTNLQMVVIGHRGGRFTDPGNIMLVCLPHDLLDPRYVELRCLADYLVHVNTRDSIIVM
jgi:hypothetical protein